MNYYDPERCDPTTNCENAVMVAQPYGDYVSYDDYKALLDAYTAICENLTAAQGQIADAQSSIDKMETMKSAFVAIQEAAELRDLTACYEIARKAIIEAK